MFWRAFWTLPVPPLLTNGLRNNEIKAIFCQSNLSETWRNFSGLNHPPPRVYLYAARDICLVALLYINTIIITNITNDEKLICTLSMICEIEFR